VITVVFGRLELIMEEIEFIGSEFKSNFDAKH
jgi:hypothetical protein